MKNLIVLACFIAGCCSTVSNVSHNYNGMKTILKGKQLYDAVALLGPPNRAIRYNVNNYNTIQYYEWRTPYIRNKVSCKVSLIISVWSKTGKIIHTYVSRNCEK